MFVYRVHHRETLEGPYTPKHCHTCKSIGFKISHKHNRNLKQWPVPEAFNIGIARKLTYCNDWNDFIFGFDSLKACFAWFGDDIDLLNQCDFVISQYVVDTKYVQSFTEGKQVGFNVKLAWIKTQFTITNLVNFNED